MRGKSELFTDGKDLASKPIIRDWAEKARQFIANRSLWLLIFPLLLLLPYLNTFPYPSVDSAYSDLTITHYPNAYFLKESISSFREVPLWSSTILSGYPFASNPLSGMWYPFSWLILMVPFPLGFNLMIGFHLVWGGLGMYYLMKQEGIGKTAALFAGIAFALLPKLFSHYGAGHLTLLFAIPWTPWLLWSQRAASAIHFKGWKFTFAPGLILALILMADIRWGAFAAVLWWSYSIVNENGSKGKLVLSLARHSLLGLLLAAPLILPLLEYSLLATRSNLSSSEISVFSLPVASFFGLFYPGLGGFHEWVLYPGGVVLILTVAAIILRSDRFKVGFWLGVFLVSLTLALGSQLPGFEILARLPLVNLLRVPSRALFLTGMSLAALAGYGLEKMRYSKNMQSGKMVNLVLFALIGFVSIFALGIYFIEGQIPTGLLWGVCVIAIAVLWVELQVNTRIQPRIWIVGLFLLALLDLGTVNLKSFHGKAVEDVYSEREMIAQFLASQPGDFRIYSPSYSIPQQTAVRYGLELADGVDPLQLESYARFMEAATGVPRSGYSVTMPPFATGDPKLDNEDYTPDAEKLGLLSVGYVVADFPVNADGLSLINKYEDVYVYKNSKVMERAWVELNNQSLKPAKILARTGNQVSIEAEGPGQLVISEIDYPGWEVWIDGNRGVIETEAGLLRSVELEDGTHLVKFLYRPGSLFMGVMLGIGGIFFLWVSSIHISQRKVEQEIQTK